MLSRLLVRRPSDEGRGAEAPSLLELQEADSIGTVPRIAGIGAPIMISQMEELSEGKILGQVSPKETPDLRQLADDNSRASWPG